MRENKVDSQLSKVVEFTQVLMAYHSDDSLAHFKNVKRYTKQLVVHYNMLFPDKAFSDRDSDYIYEGAKLHDIGKISLPDKLLRKKGKLDASEFDEMKRHTVIGAEIVDSMAEIYNMDQERHILHNICLYHHERYDGTGYPEGLKGDDIPLEAQFVSIAGVYDALTENNYSDPVSHEEAIQKIISGECGQFNPELIECLKSIENDLDIIMHTPAEERWELLGGAYAKNHHNYWIVKRVFNVIGSVVGLAVLSPFLLFSMAAIMLEDPKAGPFFKQTRLGRHKRPFTMYKFRIMKADADERRADFDQRNAPRDEPSSILNDLRLLRYGRFLRKHNLNDLPQLINVLKGDMTIVGPRPLFIEEVENFSRYQEMRLSITPGMTCVWQKRPEHENANIVDQWVDMNVSYIGTRSVIQDIRIILKTALAVLFRGGQEKKVDAASR